MTTTRSSARETAQRALAARGAGAKVTSADADGQGTARRHDEIGTRRTIVIERVEPELDGGRHPVKRVVGDTLHVSADIFAEGHGFLDAALLLRADDEPEWREAPMRLVDNDRWAGELPL